MPNSKKVPKNENEKDFKKKKLFKRFKINLETLEIEKSDFNKKQPNNEHYKENEDNKKNIQDSTIENNKSDTEEKSMSETKEEINYTSEEQATKKTTEEINFTTKKEDNFNGQNDEIPNQNSLSFEENEIEDENFPLQADEQLSLSAKIKEILDKCPEMEFSILSLFGLAIGLFFIIIGVLILLGNSEKVVDNVISGENNALSVLFDIIGIIFIVFSLLKIFPQKKSFGNVFNTINDFESKINEDKQENEEPEENNEHNEETKENQNNQYNEEPEKLEENIEHNEETKEN